MKSYFFALIISTLFVTTQAQPNAILTQKDSLQLYNQYRVYESLEAMKLSARRLQISTEVKTLGTIFGIAGGFLAYKSHITPSIIALSAAGLTIPISLYLDHTAYESTTHIKSDFDSIQVSNTSSNLDSNEKSNNLLILGLSGFAVCVASFFLIFN